MKRKKIWLLLLLIILAAVAAWTVLGQKKDSDNQPQQESGAKVAESSYNLKLLNNSDFQPNQSQTLSIQIIDDDGQVFKGLETTHGDRAHLVAIRKDRTNFQYLTATYNSESGTFTLNDFSLPTDGPYRLLVEFIPQDAGMGPEGQKLPATVYKDIEVGDITKYQPAAIGSERLKDSANGFDINIFMAPHDDSDPGLISGSTSSFAVSVNKNGQPFTGLEKFQDSRGSIMLFGPDLEFVHAHTTNNDVPDTFVLSFSLTFPVSGKYKAYLQTKADGITNLTDYVLTVK